MVNIALGLIIITNDRSKLFVWKSKTIFSLNLNYLTHTINISEKNKVPVLNV